MEQLKERIHERSIDGKALLCKEALKIAEELKINPLEVGKACNQLNIKIKGCQLGCFK